MSCHVMLCHVMSGEKVLVRWFRGYLISVIYGSRGGSARAVAAKQTGKDIMTISIYDIQNQFVGEDRLLSDLLGGLLRCVCSIPGDSECSCGGYCE